MIILFANFIVVQLGTTQLGSSFCCVFEVQEGLEETQVAWPKKSGHAGVVQSPFVGLKSIQTISNHIKPSVVGEFDNHQKPVRCTSSAEGPRFRQTPGSLRPAPVLLQSGMHCCPVRAIEAQCDFFFVPKTP